VRLEIKIKTAQSKEISAFKKYVTRRSSATGSGGKE